MKEVAFEEFKNFNVASVVAYLRSTFGPDYEEYIVNFEKHCLDGEGVLSLTDADLQAVQPLGFRKKIQTVLDRVKSTQKRKFEDDFSSIKKPRSSDGFLSPTYESRSLSNTPRKYERGPKPDSIGKDIEGKKYESFWIPYGVVVDPDQDVGSELTLIIYQPERLTLERVTRKKWIRPLVIHHEIGQFHPLICDKNAYVTFQLCGGKHNISIRDVQRKKEIPVDEIDIEIFKPKDQEEQVSLVGFDAGSFEFEIDSHHREVKSFQKIGSIEYASHREKKVLTPSVNFIKKMHQSLGMTLPGRNSNMTSARDTGGEISERSGEFATRISYNVSYRGKIYKLIANSPDLSLISP